MKFTIPNKTVILIPPKAGRRISPLRFFASLRMMTFLLGFSGLALAALVLPVWFKTESVPLCVRFHFSGVFLLGVCLCLRKVQIPKRDLLQPVLFFNFLLIFFFPGFGVIGVTLIAVFVQGLSKQLKTGLYDAYETEILEKQGDSLGPGFYINALRQIRDEVSFEPLVDILAGSDARLKAKAIDKLSKRPTRENILLLKEATRDPSPDVRLHAAGALLKVEVDIQEKIERAIKRTEVEGTAPAYAELGGLYRTAAHSGLMEKTLMDFYLSLSIEAYQHSMDIETRQPHVIASYAQSLMELDHFDRAKKLMDRALLLWPENEELIFLRNEICYGLGLYQEIPAAFKDIERGKLEERKRDVLEFWT